MEGKAERQPLFSVEVIGRNGKRQLLVLEDQPGENLLHEQFHLPADCTVVYLIDGADPDSTPVSDYVKLAAETSFVKRFVIAVTKSDRLPAEAVQQAMLAEYDAVSAQFTFPELQLIKSSVYTALPDQLVMAPLFDDPSLSITRIRSAPRMVFSLWAITRTVLSLHSSLTAR